MGSEERDQEDVRPARASRRESTDRLDAGRAAQGDPVNPDWRGARSTRRGRPSQGLPSSRQEFVLWLQYGGWRVLVAAIVLVAVLIALIYVTRTPSKANSPFERPTEAAASGGAVNVPILPSVTPAVISPTLTVATATGSAAGGGAQFRVYKTGGEGLFLRADHSTDSQQLKTLNDGTIVTVIGPDYPSPERVWKHVRDPDGSEGWVAADFLQAVP